MSFIFDLGDVFESACIECVYAINHTHVGLSFICEI